MNTPKNIDVALVAYNAVWQGWSGIEASNVDLVRRTAMTAAFNAAARQIKIVPAEIHALSAVYSCYYKLAEAVDEECTDAYHKAHSDEMTEVEGIAVISRYINKELAKRPRDAQGVR